MSDGDGDGEKRERHRRGKKPTTWTVRPGYGVTHQTCRVGYVYMLPVRCCAVVHSEFWSGGGDTYHYE
jgi:hypothetical protein